MMQNTKMVTDESLMELEPHGTEAFPFKYYCEKIGKLDFGKIDWHWHMELEFVSVSEGTIRCFVGDRELDLAAGDGVLVNVGKIHKMETPETATISSIVFAPAFLTADTSVIYEQYVRPFLDSDISCVVLKRDVLWQREILELLLTVYRHAAEQSRMWELECHTQICRIWSGLVRHQQECAMVTRSRITKLSEIRFKQMTGYMEEHYQERISLEQIAGEAHISKSEALRCFKEMIQSSPIRYLNRLRLRKARRMLAATEKSVTEIAALAGFDNVSYFDRMFRREYGITPGDARSR